MVFTQWTGIILETPEVYALLVLIELIHHKVVNEGVLFLEVFRSVYVTSKEPPEAADEVSDHEDDHNQSEDFIDVHGDVETLETVGSGAVFVVSFDHSFKPACVQDCHEFREPKKSDHPGVLRL